MESSLCRRLKGIFCKCWCKDFPPSSVFFLLHNSGVCSYTEEAWELHFYTSMQHREESWSIIQWHESYVISFQDGGAIPSRVLCKWRVGTKWLLQVSVKFIVVLWSGNVTLYAHWRVNLKKLYLLGYFIQKHPKLWIHILCFSLPYGFRAIIGGNLKTSQAAEILQWGRMQSVGYTYSPGI